MGEIRVSSRSVRGSAGCESKHKTNRWSERGGGHGRCRARTRPRRDRFSQAESLLLQGYAPGRELAAVSAVARAAVRRLNIMVRFVVLQLALRTCGSGRLDSAVGRRVTIDLVTTIALRAGLLCGELRLRNWRACESKSGRERYEFR